MKKILRALILSTARFAPLNFLYRGLYHIAAYLCVAYVRRTLGLTDLFFRGSYARGDFRPGLSDLDFLLLVESELSDRELLVLVNRVRGHHCLLRRCIPFLGEMEVLESRLFESWLSVSLDRHQIRSGLNLSYDVPNEPEDWEFERKALSDFVFMWQPNINQWDEREVDRLYKKILVYYGRATSGSPRPERGRWRQTAHLFALLDEFGLAQDSSVASESIRNFLPTDFIVELPPCLRPFRSNIVSFVRSPFDQDDCLVVLALPISPLGTEEIFRSCGESGLQPIFLTQNSISLYNHYVSPLHALSLTGDLELWGDENVWTNLSLNNRDFNLGMTCTAGQAMTLIYTQEIPLKDLEYLILGWFLRITRFLKNGAPELYYHDVLDYYQQKEPLFHARIVDLLKDPNELAAFGLLREIAIGWSASLERDQTLS